MSEHLTTTIGEDDARVGIVMGSDSDWPVMCEAANALAEFGISYEVGVVSAHRMPEEMVEFQHDLNAAAKAKGQALRDSF